MVNPLIQMKSRIGTLGKKRSRCVTKSKKKEVKIMANSKVIEILNVISSLINEIISLLKEEENAPVEEVKTISFEDFKSELIDHESLITGCIQIKKRYW